MGLEQLDTDDDSDVLLLFDAFPLDATEHPIQTVTVLATTDTDDDNDSADSTISLRY